MWNEAQILQTLKAVIDPELGCNIVELGLVYSVEIAGANVTVKMTLTTPGCPMHESMAEGVRTALAALDGVERAEVELVWDPPWNPAMLSPAARRQLGVEV